LWVPPLSDKYGRKTIFRIGSIANFIIFTLIILSHSFWLTVACEFFIGVFSTVRVNIGYPYMAELVGQKYRTAYGTLWSISEGLIFIYATIYFLQISTKWIYFTLIGYCLQIISMVLVFFLPESPVYLMTKGLGYRARDSFRTIAKCNGRL
jgi:MFS family permease